MQMYCSRIGLDGTAAGLVGRPSAEAARGDVTVASATGGGDATGDIVWSRDGPAPASSPESRAEQ